MGYNGSYLLIILICLFAIGSWITVNGVWVEIPLLVNQLPEGWKLPTYLTTLVQISNIAPLIYMLVYHFGSFKHLERFTIYLILSISIVCGVLLSIFWSYKLDVFIFNEMKSTSVAFLVLVLIMSFLDTTSSLTFVPYLVNYPRQYLTALYVGEGLSGLVPGIVGLFQGVGGDPYCVNKTIEINGTNHTEATLFYPLPNFTISEFFVFLSVLLMICLISFSIIDAVPYFQQFKTSRNSVEYKRLSDTPEIGMMFGDSDNTELDFLVIENPKSQSRKRWIIYVMLVAYITFFTNGILPSIQSYSLLPYSTKLYHIVVTVSQILNPLASLLTIRKWTINDLTLIILTTVPSIAIAYELVLAFYSPVPIFNETIIGQILAALAWFIIIIIFTFEKAWLAIQLQNRGHLWLQFHGLSTQIGSACGAITAFILVAICNVFKSKENLC